MQMSNARKTEFVIAYSDIIIMGHDLQYVRIHYIQASGERV